MAAEPPGAPPAAGPSSLLSCLEALTDSALLWALALQRLRAGLPLDAALDGTSAPSRRRAATGRLNLLLTDGASIAATACGDTLWYRQTEATPGRGVAASVTVASEPDDDGPGWTEVPGPARADRHPVAGPRPAAQRRPRIISDAGITRRQRRPHRRDRKRMTTIENRLPAGYRAASLRADALAGLTATPKSLPPKWFYDAQGSALFEKITELPEYYPTRAERSILRAVAPQVAALTGAASLVELGSGSSDKTRLLLSALRDAGTLRQYVPVDVSESALTLAGDALAAEYPGLAVHAVVADFEQYLGVPAAVGAGAAGGDHDGNRGQAAAARAGTGPGCSRSSGQPSATWSPPNARSSCAGSGRGCAQATRSCSAPTWSRTRPCSSPPTTTPPG